MNLRCRKFWLLVGTVLLVVSPVSAQNNLSEQSGMVFPNPAQQRLIYGTPYQSSPAPSPVYSAYPQGASYYQQVSGTQQIGDTQAEPPERNVFEKLNDWVDNKINKPDPNDPKDLEEQMANLKIRSGEAKLKALKTKQKLEKHILECERTTQNLQAEYESELKTAERYDAELKLLENQINSNQFSEPYQQSSPAKAATAEYIYEEENDQELNGNVIPASETVELPDPLDDSASSTDAAGELPDPLDGSASPF